MMNYREIGQSGEIRQYIADIWRYEEGLPRWFAAASKAWTATEEAFEECVLNCWKVYGFFEDDKLLAVVYMDRARSEEVHIHLSVVEMMDVNEFVEHCRSLRDELFHQGIKVVRGWILGKNFALAKLLGTLGFRQTGLRCDHGISHGRILRWECMEIRTI